MVTTVQTTTATENGMDLLAERFVFRDAPVIANFVRQYPDVVAPLLEAVAVIPRFFGRDVGLVLEVERDREALDQVQLCALIQTGLDADTALASLDQFDQEWWLDVLPRAAPHLMFALEYV